MTSKSLSDNDKPVGVIGAGNFGSVVANLLARQTKVLLYARDENVIRQIVDTTRIEPGHKMHARMLLRPTTLGLAAAMRCYFSHRSICTLSVVDKATLAYLHPYHILIHGTKGFDVTLPDGQSIDTIATLDRSMVKTISEVILEESVAVRVGCLAGPNLSKRTF